MPATPWAPPIRDVRVPSPVVGAQGYDVARLATVKFLEGFKQSCDPNDRELLRCVARTSLRTKLAEGMADQLTDIVTDAVLTIRKPDEPLDLYMARCRHLAEFLTL